MRTMPAPSISRVPTRNAVVVAALRCALALLPLTACGAPTPPETGSTMATSSSSVPGAQAALERAIDADDAAAIGVALAAGAHVDARGPHDVTPLMAAVDRQKPRAVDALLHAGADTKLVAADGAGAVSLAVENYRAGPAGPAIMKAVLEAGGDPNTIRPNGDPVIMKFVRARDCDALRLMKRAGANLDAVDRGRDPIITKAAVAMDWDVVWCLIELGARYDYEHGGARLPLSESLANKAPSPSSPIYAYKKKVWQLLKDHGVALSPLPQ
jgi:hypothetical protein